ncbi:hypothetical protein AMTR_s00174p00022220 [Amborella trichopoda]|uniref:Non-haem dioxygenase N-terminal domain-containing protein n=1 Tax=Amborella trichopoda TaxID=13333 RepID=U5CWZ6_AMBTC|nr:hypothetical protein AMTR_s00174p00022220 [Amborella trichopoda]
MGSQSAMKLPVLDFSGDLKHGDERWNALTREVQGALEGPGCFEAVYNTAVLESLQKEMASLPHAPFFEVTGIDHSAQPESVEQFTDTTCMYVS